MDLCRHVRGPHPHHCPYKRHKLQDWAAYRRTGRALLLTPAELASVRARHPSGESGHSLALLRDASQPSSINTGPQRECQAAIFLRRFTGFAPSKDQSCALWEGCPNDVTARLNSLSSLTFTEPQPNSVP